MITINSWLFFLSEYGGFSNSMDSPLPSSLPPSLFIFFFSCCCTPAPWINRWQWETLWRSSMGSTSQQTWSFYRPGQIYWMAVKMILLLNWGFKKRRWSPRFLSIQWSSVIEVSFGSRELLNPAQSLYIINTSDITIFSPLSGFLEVNQKWRYWLHFRISISFIYNLPLVLRTQDGILVVLGSLPSRHWPQADKLSFSKTTKLFTFQVMP